MAADVAARSDAAVGPVPLPGWLRIAVIVATLAALLLAMDALRIFGTSQLFSRWVLLETHYYYGLLTLLLPLGFLAFPAGARRLWLLLDVPLWLAATLCCGYLFANADRILNEGWEFIAPEPAVWVSIALWALMLEALRRCGGTVLFVLVSAFSVYPVVADVMPGTMQGISTSWRETAVYHAMSTESILGLPFRAFANLVIGFLVFGVALSRTGGGRFFLDLAFALLGTVRGGPAKVAILSSGLMGSMSGSVITNVMTTGQLTIPTMKRSGFSASYAGGVEACASTGGVLLPPIMGSTAFVMATFLEVPYYQVAVAGIVPALLYFLGLFIQVDAYAAKHRLAGLDAAELPRLGTTLKQGWYYLGAFAALIFMLIYLQREAIAPYYATGLLLVLNQFSKAHRWGFSELLDFVAGTGRLLIELLVVLAGVGLIVGALSLTGLSGTLVNDLLYFADGSVWALLLMGALTSFVLGIGMTVTAAYIFLAIILAPALIQGGLDPMSVHLFILYWGMLSFITPPVALGAFAAASIAGARPMQTGFTAMRLGGVIYFIPFFFVLDPAFILDGSWGAGTRTLVEALLGIWLIAGGLQGYLPGIGRLGAPWPFAGVIQLLMVLGGVAVALPDLRMTGIEISENLQWVVAAAALGAAWTVWRLGRWRVSPAGNGRTYD